MNSLIVVTLLSCMFATGYAITCSTCTETSSDNPNFQPPPDPNAVTCDNPVDEVCEEGSTSCMTMIVNMHFTLNSDPISILQKHRMCGGGPAGDVCLSQEMIAMYTQGMPDPADIFADLGLPLDYVSHDTSVCLCDSADNCTPPSADAVAATQPEPEPTPVAGDNAGGTVKTTTDSAASSLVASMAIVHGSLLHVFFCRVMQ